MNLAKGTAHGGGGRDRLSTIEAVKGSAGNDVLVGNGGSNALFGLAGNDRISGRGGNDFLDGGAGTDTLDGGPGTDQCVNGETVHSCERLTGGGPDVAEVAKTLGITPSQAASLVLLAADATPALRHLAWVGRG